jgi:hypothetical protein
MVRPTKNRRLDNGDVFVSDYGFGSSLPRFPTDSA